MRGATSLGRAAGSLFEGHRWIVAAVGAGALPLLLAGAWGGSLHQGVSSLLLFMLIIGAAHTRRFARGVIAMGLAFGAHGAVAIAFARFFPETTQRLFPGGAEYWAQTYAWLVSGQDPEYQVSAWLPAHLQLAGAMIVLGYLSMGLIPFLQGFHEVDLMNYYVGRLLSASGDAPVSFALGWHPWSVVRGLGFCVIVMSLAQVSYDRFTGRPSAAWRGQVLRFGLGLALLGLDGLMKYALLDVVRQGLAARLVGGPG